MVDDLTDVLDFDSEGIDGLDDDAGENSESMGAELPPRHTTYTWWIRARRTAAVIRKIKPPGKSQNDGADAAQSPAIVKTVIKAREGSTPQITPKATMTI